MESSSLPLVDCGASLTHRKFAKDVDAVIRRAEQSGVSRIVATSSTLHGSKESLRLAHLFPGLVYATAGVHPHDARAWEGESSADALFELLTKPECVALGVCGLDFSKDFSKPEKQIEAFQQQLELARRAGKPVILHERHALSEVLNVLGDRKECALVISCFSGDFQETQSYLELNNVYFGLTGALWKDKSELGVRQVLRDGLIPLDKMLLASDSPFLYPNTRASKLPRELRDAVDPQSLSFLDRYCTFQRNEPCSLPVTQEMIAATIGETKSQVAIATTMNALKVFGLSA